MSHAVLYVLAAAALFGLGVHGLIIAGHLLRKLLALNLMGSAVFLLLVAAAEPIAGQPDPIPQALVLTGIVVSVSATALALALLVRLYRETGLTRLPWRDDDDG